MRATRALRPTMLRGIVQVIVVFFFLRILFWLLRLVTAGSRSDTDSRSRTSAREAPVQRRKAMRVDPSNVTDVPFTEIPAGGDAPRAETQPSERIEAR